MTSKMRWALLAASFAIGGAAAPAPNDPQLNRLQAEAGSRNAYRIAYDAMPDTPGSGPFPARMEEIAALPGYTIYRPANPGRPGRRKLGLVIWGNGACSDDAASARLHLAEIASHGFLVIASGRILSGPSAAPSPSPYQAYLKTTTAQMRRALDWALAENGRPGSPWHRRIDPRQVAVSGHSCGGMQAIELASDPRVRALVVMFSGIFPERPGLSGEFRFSKASLAGLHRPVLYVVGNESDVGRAPALDDFSRITKVPVFVAAKRDLGHEGTFARPNGGIAAEVAVAWLKWQLRGDRMAGQRFVGPDCGLCRDAGWEVWRKGW